MICPACENTIPDHLERCPICEMLFTCTGLALDPPHLAFEEDETTTLELPSDLARPVATPGEPGRYAILRRLGSGGMGVVYKVYDHKMERLVAVKRLNPQREKRGGILRFFSEAKAIARLNHPGIVSIFDIVEDRRGFFIVMELVRGISLRMWIKKHGPLPPSVGAPILRQVAEALRYAHGRNIVHRDVKPGNILIGRGRVPKIVDFGVAVIGDDPSGTRAGRVAGTRGYIAPEVRWNRGEADPRADIYSFGMTVLEVFSGVKPWLAKEYPPFASDFILYATRENPNDRFQNVESLLDAWEEVAERCERESGEVPAHVQRILAPPSERHNVVEIRGGGRDGETVTLSEAVTLIGRSRLRCAVSLNDTQISRVHLKIVREEGEAYAFDMGSHNGTFVGSQQVRAVRLTEGLELRIGNCVLRFL